MIDSTLKDKLMGALSTSVGYINDGTPARAAVIKAAADSDFNVEQSRRLCELFNTARTLYHFEQNPGQKEASFELVDADDVLGEIFTAPTGSPKIAQDAVPDYTEYDSPELMARDGNVVDTTADLWPKAAEELPSLDMQARRAYRIIDTQMGLAKQAQSECRQAEIHVSQSLSKLAAAIAHDCATHGPERYARFLRVHDSQDDQPMLAKLAEYLPAYVQAPSQVKQASDRVVEDRDLAPWTTNFKFAKRMQHQSTDALAIANTVEKEAQEFESAFLDLAGGRQAEPDVLEQMLAPFVEKRSADPGTYTIPTLDVGATLDSTFNFTPEALRPQYDSEGKPIKGTGITGTRTVERSPSVPKRIVGAAAAPVGEATKDYVSSGLKLLGQQGVAQNKTITERLKNQQREVLLQDLLSSDPFISEADPQAVANGYLTIMQVAPEVSTNKEVVRAVLRQLIHTGALSTFDASSLADLEKTIRETAGTLPRQQPAGVKR
jgi:hypothetical protein